MGCLKGGTVAGVVVPTADYVRFATHYGFRPDFCEGHDPESKGIVENLVGYVKSDLMIPAELTVDDLAGANAAGVVWRDEVNAAVHSEIVAVPAERLEIERELLGALPSLRPRIGKLVIRKVDRLSCVRFGSARYSVPTRHIAQQVEVRVVDGGVAGRPARRRHRRTSLVAPGETSIIDDHYGGPRPTPRRAVRPKTKAEIAFCALGPAAEAFIKAAAAAGMTTLGGDLDELAGLQAAHGRDALIAALERAVTFGRFRARRRPVDPRRGHRGRPRTGPATRSSSRCRPSPPGRCRTTRSGTSHDRPARRCCPPISRPDCAASASARCAASPPNSWSPRRPNAGRPRSFLRTLLEAEIASRDASNARGRLKAAAFPVTKTLDEFDLAASSIKTATFDYLVSLEWIAARENLCLVGPAGTGKSHLLVALGHAAVDAGHRVRYFTAAELVETLYRGLADNSVGRVIDNILRADLILIDEIGFAPLDDNGAQLLFRLVAAAYERRSLGIGSHWPFEDWGRFLPEHTTAVSLLDRLLHHAVLVPTEGESYRMKQARTNGGRTRRSTT